VWKRGRSEMGIGVKEAKGASIWCICLSRSGQVDYLPTELVFRHLAVPLSGDLRVRIECSVSSIIAFAFTIISKEA
jgi:hypothetical protein